MIEFDPKYFCKEYGLHKYSRLAKSQEYLIVNMLVMILQSFVEYNNMHMIQHLEHLCYQYFSIKLKEIVKNNLKNILSIFSFLFVYFFFAKNILFCFEKKFVQCFIANFHRNITL